MSAMFQGASKLNVEVLDWNTAVVTCMPAMFEGAIEFDCDISD